MFISPIRIKALKDLVIEKLDLLLANAERMDKFLDNQSAAETADASTLENDSSILEALTFLINRIQEGSSVNLEYLATLLSNVEQMHQEVTLIREDLKLERSPGYRPDGSVEIDLMSYLYSFMPNRFALDIGANVGKVSECLLETGYRVIAFEPNPLTFERLSERLDRHEGLQLHRFAIGRTDADMHLHIAEDFSPTNIGKDATLYSSLVMHPLPCNLRFTHSADVKVRSLESLHYSLEIPNEVGLLKIAAVGFDLEIIQGMGEHRYPLVVCRYQDGAMFSTKGGAYSSLNRLVPEMRNRGYWWHIVIHRDRDDIGFYCNSPHSFPGSWGSVFFFQEQAIFSQALSWCSKSIPSTNINQAIKPR